MTRFVFFINVLLSLELIIAPIVPHLHFFTTPAHAGTCSQGFQWDSTLNRCLTSMETASIMNATASCAPDDIQCYKSNAEAELKKKENAGDVSKRVGDRTGFVSTVLDASAVAFPLTMGVSALRDEAVNKNSCSSVSYYALIAGGVSLFVGDMFADMKHKSRLKSIKRDWDKILSPNAADETDPDNLKTNATEAQSQAFEMLARSEDSLAKAAGTKKTFYTIAMGAFAVSTGLAIYELMNPITAASSYCKPSATKGADEAVPEAVPEIEPTDTPGQGKDWTHIDHEKSQKSFIEKISALYDQKELLSFNRDLHAFDKKIKKQKLYNLNQASSLSDFYILHHEYKMSSSPTLEEYSKTSQFIKGSALDNADIFSAIKSVTMKILNEMNPIPVAKAQVKNALTAGAIAAGLVFQKTLLQFLVGPEGRAYASGILFSWSTIMANHAKSQQKASKNRANLLRKMRDDFKSASGAINQCTSEDRNSTAKPQCYCYTSTGGRNPNRGNSKICQQLFAGKDFSIGNYFGVEADSMQGCMSNKCTYDESCACKKTNSCGCLKTPRTSLKGIDPGSFSMLTSGLAPAVKLTGGTSSSAGIDTASLEKNAMRIMEGNKKLEDKLGANYKAAKSKASGILQKAANRAAASAPASGLASNQTLPLNPKDAISQLTKEISEQRINEVSGTAGTLGVATSKENGPTLDFGFAVDETTVQKDQIAEVMKQDLDYGQNDIHKSSTNIFELLSHRYQRSGMRRLFDEKGLTRPDAPAKNDISR